jgi:hypothetical protein
LSVAHALFIYKDQHLVVQTHAACTKSKATLPGAPLVLGQRYVCNAMLLSRHCITEDMQAS